MKLIDKAAVVAEIKNIEADAICQYKSDKSRYAEGSLDVIHRIKYLLDTLGVKEVDFGTEVYKYIDEHFNVYDDGNQTLQTKDKKSLIGRIDVENIAKHFFELGLKAQKL